MWEATYQTVLLLLPIRIVGFLAIVLVGSFLLAVWSVDTLCRRLGLPGLDKNPLIKGL